MSTAVLKIKNRNGFVISLVCTNTSSTKIRILMTILKKTRSANYDRIGEETTTFEEYRDYSSGESLSQQPLHVR